MPAVGTATVICCMHTLCPAAAHRAVFDHLQQLGPVALAGRLARRHGLALQQDQALHRWHEKRVSWVLARQTTEYCQIRNMTKQTMTKQTDACHSNLT
jgi:hypothetical protein